MAIRRAVIIFVVTLWCHIEYVESANGVKYPWDGECGQMTPPPPRKWMAHVPKEFHQAVDLVHEYLPPLHSGDILPCFKSWFARITYQSGWATDDMGALALIRAKIGMEESDIGIGTAQTCSYIKSFMRFYGPDSIKAHFGVQEHTDKAAHVAIIEDCFTPSENDGDFGGSSNIGVFKFKTTIKFNENTNPVCLPKVKEVHNVGTRGIAAEWDSVRIDDDDEGSLQVMPFLVMDDATCLNAHYRRSVDTDTFCISRRREHTGYYRQYRRNGIFVLGEHGKYVMHGVYRDAWPTTGTLPTWTTRIADHFDWLQATIQRVSALYP